MTIEEMGPKSIESMYLILMMIFFFSFQFLLAPITLPPMKNIILPKISRNIVISMSYLVAEITKFAFN